MLVLSRQRDESVIIGDDIIITIVDIRGEKVRLGITAPAHIPVHRKEIYEAIKREAESGRRGGPPGVVESLAKRPKPKPPPPDDSAEQTPSSDNNKAPPKDESEESD